MPVIINKLGAYQNEDAVVRLSYYMTQSPYYRYCNGRGVIGCFPEDVIRSFQFVKGMYGKEDGRQAAHFIIGAKGKEMLIFTELIEIGEATVDYFYRKGFQSFYVIHSGSDDDKNYQHIHLEVNTISYLDGNRLYESFDITSDFRKTMERVFPQMRWYSVNDKVDYWGT